MDENLERFTMTSPAKADQTLIIFLNKKSQSHYTKTQIKAI
jgi:hypothetical protein